MATAIASPDARVDPRVRQALLQYWGFDVLRPLQAEAIAAGCEGRDSLLVIPTGGGKSLCYQVPPLMTGRTDVVVSPLISLMKDQVDGLRESGYSAAALHSGMTVQQQREVETRAARGEYRLLFVAPERVLTNSCLRLMQQVNVRSFAIDEAHCISHWGHDFRPEYRRLVELRRHFPKAGLNAFTATATERVREDIIRQLALIDPAVLVGNFDRPNLTYRVLPKIDVHAQTLEAIRRHPREACIVYCISRKDTEAMAGYLQSARVNAAYYHAGMEVDDRRKTQELFAEEKLDVVVATVAFGMGIDRSNVRCVIHAAVPKSIEHYQQESGRAGRDGLAAECVLLYSAGDVIRWEELVSRSAEEAERPEEVIAATRELLSHMQRYCNAMQCRHRLLVEYFGQEFESPRCGACDICLGDVEELADATTIAQKILSCVARVQERFGAAHVADVLRGANTAQIRSFGHEKLSTYGLLKELDRPTISTMIYQLIDQKLLQRMPGERPILKLNAGSWEVMGGRKQVTLLRPRGEGVRKAKGDEQDWVGVDRGLFEHLRGWRQTLSQQRGVPAYVITGDATLRDLARLRPGSIQALRSIRGLGDRKIEQFGQAVVTLLRSYCKDRQLALDCNDNDAPPPSPRRPQAGHSRDKAFEMFGQGAAIEAVSQAIERAESTTIQYLVEWIKRERPTSIEAWVPDAHYREIAAAVAKVGTRPLKPVFEELGGRFEYEPIKLVATHIDSVGLSEARLG